MQIYGKNNDNALHILKTGGALALASFCIMQGMNKADTLAQFKQAVMDHEKAQGRVNGCAYVLADAYDQALQQFPQSRLYIEYKAEREKSMPHYRNTAISAYRSIKYRRTLAQKLASIGATGKLYTDSNNVAHKFERSGYTVTLEIESDYDFSNWEDYFPHKGGMNSQGYSVTDLSRNTYEEYERMDKRYSGASLTLVKDIGISFHNYKVVGMPESYIRQFYDNRNQSRAVAHENMIKSAKLAFEQDLENAKLDMVYASVIVRDSQGAEIYSDAIGCECDYAQSGEVFFEHGMIDEALETIEKAMQADATALEQSRPDMYQGEAA